MQICAASSLPPPFDPKQFRNLILAITPVGPGSSGINKLIQKMRGIEGFFLASSTSLKLFGKRMESEIEATEIIRAPVDPARFQLPRGFTKIPSPFPPTVR